MATLQQALTRIDAICPNAWDETAKLLWLNECESMIQTRILGVAPEQCITYDADTDRSTALLVPAPFDRLYVYYVIAMCDYAAHETAHYADSMMLFNAALDEYAKWYQRANGAAPIAPGQLQQIAANTKARHTHENLAVLDGITAEKAAAWDAKADRTAATASANGLMSKADKAKLDGIAAGATKVIVDSALSDASANPLQNKVIAAALDGKAGTATATQSAAGRCPRPTRPNWTASPRARQRSPSTASCPHRPSTLCRTRQSSSTWIAGPQDRAPCDMTKHRR